MLSKTKVGKKKVEEYWIMEWLRCKVNLIDTEAGLDRHTEEDKAVDGGGGPRRGRE